MRHTARGTLIDCEGTGVKYELGAVGAEDMQHLRTRLRDGLIQTPVGLDAVSVGICRCPYNTGQ